ncbi:MAG: DMT family transporter [Paracoccaceae bacterium]|nr:DMT family transporter [Paracoccaceae bacterium]
MLVFSALVAGSFSLGGLASPEIDPRAFMAARFLFAAVLLALLVRATLGPGRLTFAAPWRYAVLGALYAGYFVGMFWALRYGAPVSLAAVFTLTPVLAGIAGWFLLRQVTTGRMAVALAIGGVGALWVIFRADLGAFLAFAVGRGEAIFFFACVSHALYIPVVRMVNRGEPVLPFTAGVLTFAFIVLSPVAAGPALRTDWTALPPIVWITLAYIVVFATMGSSYLLAFASLRLPAAKVMAYTYLTPAWVTLWEIALGHGAPPGLVLVGVGLTLVALWLLLKNEDQALPVAR